MSNQTPPPKPADPLQTKDGGGLNGATCSAWASIDSAPRNGEVFLGFVPHEAGGFAFAAVITTDGKLACMMSGDKFPTATHWMPMPSFPILPNAIGEARADNAAPTHNQTL